MLRAEGTRIANWPSPLVRLYPAPMIPWIIIAAVAVPLVVIAFLSTRRNTTARERLASSDTEARTEQEFAEAEAYESNWHEADKERYHQEGLP